MESLYVLQLANGKYYVGKTTDVKRRIEEHSSGRGSEWTKIHKPVKVIETRRVKDEHDENNTTKDLMKKYGVDNVRGGSYSQVALPASYKTTLEAEIRGNTGACFKCGERGHFARECIEDIIEDCEEEEAPQRDSCYRCGRAGHYANECYAHTTVEGDYIKGKHRFRSASWIASDSDDD